MATRHELQIEIKPSGEVQVVVKGAKGKQCLNYVELLATIGEVKDQRPTSEFYEPGPGVGIVDRLRERIGK